MRRHFVLLSLLVAWGMVLFWHGRSLPKTDIRGVSGATLAVQLVYGQHDVDAILKPSDPQYSSRRATLVQQQYLDVVLIGLYWAFFYFSIAGPPYRSGKQPWRRLGLLIRVGITLAALADLGEDFGIVSAIGSYGLPRVWPFWFCVTKWSLIFVVLGLVSLCLFSYSKMAAANTTPPRWVEGLARLSACLFIVAAVFGVAGVVGVFSARGELLPLGALLMALGFVPLLGVFGWEAFVRKAPQSEVIRTAS